MDHKILKQAPHTTSSMDVASAFTNIDEAISPKSSDDHGSHEEGSLNTATSSPSSTPAEHSNGPSSTTIDHQHHPSTMKSDENASSVAADLFPSMGFIENNLMKQEMPGGFQMSLEFSNLFSFEKPLPFVQNLQFERFFPNSRLFSSFSAGHQQKISTNVEQAALAQLSQFINNNTQLQQQSKGQTTTLINGSNKSSPTQSLNGGSQIKSPGVTENNARTTMKRPLSNQNTIDQRDSSPPEKKRSYPYTFQYCVLCQKNVHSSKLPCHIRQCHVGKPMFQCPSCDFTSTYSKNNVKSHMVSLHQLTGDPISYMDQYSGQVEEFMRKCFPNVRGRGRPVHGRHLSIKSPPPNTYHLSSNSHTEPATNNGPHHQFMDFNVFNNNKHMPNKATTNGGESFKSQKLQSGKRTSINRILEQTPFSNEFAGFGSPFLAGGGKFLKQNQGLQQEKAPLLPLAGINNAPLNVAFNPLFYLQHFNDIATTANLHRKVGAVKEELSSNSELPDSQSKELDEGGVRLNQIANDLIDNKQTKNLDDAHGCRYDSMEEEDRDPEEPRYLPQPLAWTILRASQIQNTVFKTFRNSSEIVEKLDLSHFEQLIAKSNQFLTESQIRKISEVRQQINLKDFEVLFALYRFDLNVLKPKQVEMVASIAPTSVDKKRFEVFEQVNSFNGLSEDERFIMELSKVKRLKETLTLMSFMGTFDAKVFEINESLASLTNAAKFLHNSWEFHTLLHLLLACGNLVSGDFNVQLVQGFSTSRISEMCAFRFPSGTTLMDVLATVIKKYYPEISAFPLECKNLLEQKSKEFQQISHKIEAFERGLLLAEVEAEIQQNPNANQVLTIFQRHCEMECIQLKESLNIAREQLISTMQFFGESVSSSNQSNSTSCFQPESFFRSIFQFVRDLDETLACSISS